MEGVDTRLYLGVNPETGKATHLDIAVDPGLCVIAPVGAGKSFLAGSLLGQALAKGWEGFVFDPKRLSYRRYFPQLAHEPWLCDWRMRNGYEQFVAMTEFLMLEYEHRMQYIEDLGDFDVDEWRGAGTLRPRLIVIDELQAFFTVLATRTVVTEKGEKKNVGRAMVTECQGMLATMLSLFRASGQVPVLIAQTGNIATLPAEVKNNASAKIQLGNTITDSQWVSLFGDNPPTDMPRFVGGVGKGVCQLAGEVHPVDIRRP